MASYPATVKVFTTKIDTNMIVFAAHMNDVQAEVVAIQTALGINPHVSAGPAGSVPSGTANVDVSTRIKNLEQGKSDTGHTHPTVTGGVPAHTHTEDTKRAGDTMSGRLTLSADPVSALHAVTKQYVDSAVNAINGLNAFGQGGSAIAGSHGSLNALKLQGNSDVCVTNAAGGWSLNFPNSFPTGVLTAIACSGDSANPSMVISVIGNQVTKGGMGGDAYNATGSPAGNINVRINWIALGW